MQEEYIVKGAMATCQFGVAPAMLNNIMDNMNVYFNGKLAATSMSLGPAFPSPAFGTCNMVPNMPKPCVCMITKWDNPFNDIYINRIAHPLTKNSKGTCALGCPMCISFQTTGQIPIPSMPPVDVPGAAAHQSDMNPMATNEEPTDEDKNPIVKETHFVDFVGSLIGSIPENGIISLMAETEDADPGQNVTFTVSNETSGGSITVNGVVGSDGRAYAYGVDVNTLLKRDKAEDLVVKAKI